MNEPPIPADQPHRGLFDSLAGSMRDLVIATNGNGAITYANRAALKATGHREKDLIGSPIAVLMPMDPRRGPRRASAGQEASSRKSWRGSVDMRARNGTAFRCEMTIDAIFDDRGGLAGSLLVGREVRGERPRIRAAWEAQERLVAICDSMEDGVAVCGRNGVILMCNAAYARKLGCEAEEVIGISLPYPWTDPPNAAKMELAFRLFRKEKRLSNHLITVHRKDGSTAIVSLGLAPLRTNGRPTAEAVMTVRDVTDVQYAQEARRASDQLYRLHLEVKRKAQRLQTLQDINAFVLKNADVDQIFRAITTGIKNLVGHDLAGIYLYDPDRELFFAHTLSKQTPFSRRLAKFPLPLGVGILGTAAVSGKMVWVNNAQLDPRSRYPKSMRPEKEHFIAVPLKGRYSIFGILVVARNRDPEFIEEEALIVKSFADAATVALENAQLHHEISAAGGGPRNAPRPVPVPGSATTGAQNGGRRTGKRVLARPASRALKRE